MRFYLRHWAWLWVLALGAGVLPVLIWLALPADPAWQALLPGSQALSPLEQGSLVLAVYGIKLLYMLLALAVLFLAWGESNPAWKALQGSLAAFWIGEFACATNILFFVEENLALEYLHSLFMVFCLALLFFSALEATDQGLLNFTDPQARCALVGVCKTCTKAHPETPTACLLHRLFQWMIPLSGVLALMPLMAQPLNYSFATRVYGLPRLLTHLMPIQWYELRFSPWVAIMGMLAAWLALSWRGGVEAGIRISKILLSLAAGHLGFSLMRLAFAAFYQEGLVWFIFWEELTELMLVTGVGVVVWLVRPGRMARLKNSLIM